MKKIASLFKREYEGNRLVYNEVVACSEWVIQGEGIPTEKIDGTCCMVRKGKLYKRYDAKKGKNAPEGFIPAQEPDQVTGHWPGWILVGDGNEDRYHREAFLNNHDIPDGTYELIGEKVQSNPYNINGHKLIKHGSIVLTDVPRDFDGLKSYFSQDRKSYLEGIVWHHADGRMVKIKYKDFFKIKKVYGSSGVDSDT